MLHVTEEFYGTDTILKVRHWLAQEGAALFRNAIESEILKLQAEASNDLLRGMDENMERFKHDAEKKLKRIKHLQGLLREMENAATVEFTPYNARITRK